MRLKNRLKLKRKQKAKERKKLKALRERQKADDLIKYCIEDIQV